jgi:hypothetical protein
VDGVLDELTWPFADGEAFCEGEISDEELTALALAADPDQPISVDARPWAFGGMTPVLLPQWYMPGTLVRVNTRWRRAIVTLLVLAFAAIEVSGLCSVYGQLVVG